MQVRTRDSGPLIRVFDSQSAETLLGLRWPAAPGLYAAVRAHRIEARKPKAAEESSAATTLHEAANPVVDRLYTPLFCGGSTGSSADVVPPETLCELFAEVHDFAQEAPDNGAEYVHFLLCHINLGHGLID